MIQPDKQLLDKKNNYSWLTGYCFATVKKPQQTEVEVYGEK